MSVIDVEKKEIKRISDTSLKTMRNSSAYGLPNTPANSGMKAAQVKPKFYDFALSQNGVSLFTEINRIVAEINIVLAAYGINFETINTNFDDTNESITTHENNVSNPHSVSAEQVGAYTKEEITNILETKVKALQDQLTTLDKTVSEMAGVDTGFSETITAMKNKLDNFFGETNDATDVIDTLNEIQIALDNRVVKEDGKALIADELIDYTDNEWKKGLNLFGGKITSNEVGNVVLGIANLPKGTYTVRFRSNEVGSSGGRWLFKLNGESIFEDYLISDTTFTLEKDYIQAEVTAFINCENTDITIMLVKGSKAYDYQPYNASKHITNYEADFIKEEYKKQENLINYITFVNGTTASDGKPTGIGDFSRVVSESYVSVKPNTNYTVKTNADFLVYEVNYFDVNKNSISLNTIQQASHTFTTPSNCHFIILLFRNSDDSNIYVNEVANNATFTNDATYEGEIVRTKELEEQVGGIKSLFDIKEIPLYTYWYESKEYYCFEASLGVYRVHLYDSTKGIDETITIIYDGNKNNFNYPDLYFSSYKVSINISYQSDDEDKHYTPLFHFRLSKEDHYEYSMDIAKKCTKIL